MIEKFDRWFVADWRAFWHWYSTWAHIIGSTVLGVFLLTPTMPDQVQAIVPMKWRAFALGLWVLAGFVARVVKQGPTP